MEKGDGNPLIMGRHPACGGRAGRNRGAIGPLNRSRTKVQLHFKVPPTIFALDYALLNRTEAGRAARHRDGDPASSI